MRHLGAAIEFLKWSIDVESCHYFAKFSLDVLFKVVRWWRCRANTNRTTLISNLLVWSFAVAVFVTVADVSLLFALVFLPVSTLILVIEVDNVERVLEVNEEVTRILRWIIFCFCKVDSCISVLVWLVDFLFEFFLVVLDRKIFHAKIRSEIFTTFYFFYVTRVFILRAYIT